VANKAWPKVFEKYCFLVIKSTSILVKCNLLLYFYGVNIELVIKRLDALEKKLESLEKENAFLKECLSKYENPKNSRKQF